jgi:hypothetical protein
VGLVTSGAPVGKRSGRLVCLGQVGLFTSCAPIGKGSGCLVCLGRVGLVTSGAPIGAPLASVRSVGVGSTSLCGGWHEK